MEKVEQAAALLQQARLLVEKARGLYPNMQHQGRCDHIQEKLYISIDVLQKRKAGRVQANQDLFNVMLRPKDPNE